MIKKLTVSQKMSEKFSKLCRKIYCDYRTSHGNYTHRSQVYVIGNSKWNQDGVLFSPMRMEKHSIFIITEVDEGSNLVATYIVPTWYIKSVVKWFYIPYTQEIKLMDEQNIIVHNKQVCLCKVNYVDIMKYEDKLLLELVNKERELNNE